ncbi:hypothetical protein MMC34_003070 [Xylographa carneopallida]|nr:hypothetical protein [Xylographa carneopallida]
MLNKLTEDISTYEIIILGRPDLLRGRDIRCGFRPSLPLTSYRFGWIRSFPSFSRSSTVIESKISTCFALASSGVPFRYWTQDEAALVCMQCLVAGMNNDKQRVRLEDLTDGFHQLGKIVRHFNAIAKATTREEIAYIQAKTYTAIIYGHMVGSAIIGRVLCLSNDKYMVLAPIGTKVGDKICVIHGLPVPFIIRPEGDMFLLVGEYYVQGVMDGEVMDMEHIKTQEIDLK